MIVINFLGGLFVFMVLAVIVGNSIGWIIDTYDELFHPAPPPAPPKVEWDEDKPLWNKHRPD